MIEAKTRTHLSSVAARSRETIALTLCALSLVFALACSSQPTAKGPETPIPQAPPRPSLPEWITAPFVEDGFAATVCVRTNASLSILKQKATTLARKELAQQISVRVKAMDKIYQHQTELAGEGSSSGSTFESISVQITDQYLAGSRPRRTDYVELPDGQNLCVLVELDAASTDRFYQAIVDTSGRELDSEEDLTLNDEFSAYKAASESAFLDYKKELLEEFEAYQTIVDEETSRFSGKVETKWEKPVLSTNKVWVEYSPDLSERRSIDFANETITIEMPESGGSVPDDAVLKQALIRIVRQNKAEAFESDAIATAVEARSREELKLAESRPLSTDSVLIPYLLGRPSASDAQVEAIVDHMIEGKQVTTHVEKGVTIRKVVLPLDVPIAAVESIDFASTSSEMDASPDGLSRKAKAIWPHVDRYAEGAEVEQALVYAVIETESAFNPMARSHVPAYGLMQIVPRSAGLDATERLFGKGKGRVLAPSYLYDSEKNIEIGAIYLNILYFRYLRRIEDPVSRLYCAIAAYNTGAGNVARAFTGKANIRKASEKINSMTPKQVYDHLIAHLPHEETQRYLDRVSRRRSKFTGQLGG